MRHLRYGGGHPRPLFALHAITDQTQAGVLLQVRISAAQSLTGEGPRFALYVTGKPTGL